jgi:ATP-dependent RNA helicase SUPV3L1/SUV3
LLATKRGRLIGVLPRATDVLMARGAMGATAMSGFRELGAQTVRIDLIERIARQAHDGRTGRNPFALDTALATSIGMTAATLDRLMVQLGFRPVLPTDQVKRWVWAGRPSVVKSVGPVRDTAFAGLAAMVTRLG